MTRRKKTETLNGTAKTTKSSKKPMPKNRINEIAVSEPEKSLEPATKEQMLYGRLTKEMDYRAQYMKKVSELQKEILNLRTQLSAAHEQLINMQINNLVKENKEIRNSIGLDQKDQIVDNLEGHEGEWFRVSQ